LAPLSIEAKCDYAPDCFNIKLLISKKYNTMCKKYLTLGIKYCTLSIDTITL
jgi:hypothetical protein